MRKTKEIRIGNHAAFSAASSTLPFEYAVENGFDAFEWFPDRKASGAGWDERDLDRDQRRAIQQSAAMHDVALSVHAPWWINPLKAGDHPRIFRDLDMARELGATILNIHLYPEEGIPAFVASIIPVIKRCRQQGVTLVIENCPRTSPEDFNALFSLLGQIHGISLSQVGMCLDIGHANLCPATRNDYLQYLDRLDEEVPIRHMHLHENYGDSDSHLTLFTGPAGSDPAGIQGLIRRMKARGFSGRIILEQWPDPPSLLNAAREKFLELWDKA